MMQAARNLTDIDEGFLRGKPYLILDRDTKYSDAFRSLLVRDGIKIIRLRRMIFLGQASLRHAVKHFMAHYHAERNHQGLGNQLLQPLSATPLLRGVVRRRQRLGGMLSYYCREAA